MDEKSLDFFLDHKILQETMKQEITALRGVLDLMKEEEIFYSSQKNTAKKTLLEKKAEANKKLKTIQKKRSEIIKKITRQFFNETTKSHFNSSCFNAIIRKDEENSLETFHLRDQILNFMKIIKNQKERLISLKKQPEPIIMVELTGLEPIKKINKKVQTLDHEPLNLEDC